MDFIVLTLKDKCEEQTVLVKVSRICFIESIKDGETKIVFENKELCVLETLDDILDILFRKEGIEGYKEGTTGNEEGQGRKNKCNFFTPFTALFKF